MNNRRLIFAVATALVAGGLLAISLRLPLWHMRMEAPQYRGPEALKVVVLPGALRGDINEIKTLNQYIGVSVPDKLPQTQWLPAAICGLAILGLVVAFLPSGVRRHAAFGVAVLLTGTMLLAAGQAKLQMYHIGHDRNRHAALAGVPDFTAPLLGDRKLAQFELESRLGYGSFAIAGAVALYLAMAFAGPGSRAAVRSVEDDLLMARTPQVADYSI